MPIVDISDEWADTNEKNKLKTLFGVKNDAEFDAAVQGIARAALTEYKTMLLGQRLPGRADEIRQHRLFYLIKECFGGKMPSETQVSDYFQLTPGQSRNLIQSTRTRFRYELETEVNQTLKDVIVSATQAKADGPFRVVIRSDNVLEELKEIIEEEWPDASQISKVPSSARIYKIEADTYLRLKNKLT